MNRMRASQWLLLSLSLCLLLSPPARAEEKGIPVTLTVLYDNESPSRSAGTDWGFACLVQGLAQVILFDSGSKGTILVENAGRRGIDLRTVDAVVLSHHHGDHTRGLPAVLERAPQAVVYLPPGDPLDKSALVPPGILPRKIVQASTANRELCPGAVLTGALGTQTKEQALVLRTSRGLAILTGCAHPGIDHIAETVAGSIGPDLRLVAGGFHLLKKTEPELEAVVARLRQLGVRQAAPSHCTGAAAIQWLRKTYGADFVPFGLGVTLVLE